MGTGESVGMVVARIEDGRRRLTALSGACTAQAACELGRTLSNDIAHVLDDLAAESPAARAAARAAAERFDSHVLAATLLEASHASPRSVFELIGRGLIRLTADVERLARTRRVPA